MANQSQSEATAGTRRVSRFALIRRVRRTSPFGIDLIASVSHVARRPRREAPGDDEDRRSVNPPGLALAVPPVQGAVLDKGLAGREARLDILAHPLTRWQPARGQQRLTVSRALSNL